MKLAAEGCVSGRGSVDKTHPCHTMSNQPAPTTFPVAHPDNDLSETKSFTAFGWLVIENLYCSIFV